MPLIHHPPACPALPEGTTTRIEISGDAVFWAVIELETVISDTLNPKS